MIQEYMLWLPVLNSSDLSSLFLSGTFQLDSLSSIFISVLWTRSLNLFFWYQQRLLNPLYVHKWKERFESPIKTTKLSATDKLSGEKNWRYKSNLSGILRLFKFWKGLFCWRVWSRTHVWMNST